jgi:hypothetical protein
MPRIKPEVKSWNEGLVHKYDRMPFIATNPFIRFVNGKGETIFHLMKLSQVIAFLKWVVEPAMSLNDQ